MNLLMELVSRHQDLIAEMTTVLGFAKALIAFSSTTTLFTLRVRRCLRQHRVQQQVQAATRVAPMPTTTLKPDQSA
jgi:hypothetical protein